MESQGRLSPANRDWSVFRAEAFVGECSIDLHADPKEIFNEDWLGRG